MEGRNFSGKTKRSKTIANSETRPRCRGEGGGGSGYKVSFHHGSQRNSHSKSLLYVPWVLDRAAPLGNAVAKTGT